MICDSLSTEHGPAITTNSSPPISVPLTRTRVRCRAEFPADEFVGRRDAHGALHAGHGFELLQARGDVTDAHGADDHPLLALNRVDLVAEFLDALANVVDLFLGWRAAPSR